MNESDIKSISESQFKRICGEVWADSLSKFDFPRAAGSIADEETKVLRQVLDLIRNHLDLEEDASTAGCNSPDCRNQITVLIRRHASAPFDHNRVIDRLLRELLQKQVA